jgi:hypothetical protein
VRGRAFVVASLFCACGSFDEAAPANDAGGDGASGLDASIVDSTPDAPFCAEDGGTFCDDFDDPRRGTFPEEVIDDGGTLTVVPSPHFSPPSSLHIVVPKTTMPYCTSAARVVRNVRVPAPNGFVVEYKLHLVTIGGPVDLGAAAIMHNVDGTEECNYYMEVTPAALTLAIYEKFQDGGGVDHNTPLGRKVLPGEWTSIVVDVHGIAGGRTLTVKVGDVVAVKDVAVPGGCQNGNFVVQASMGASCVFPSSTGPLDVFIDDVRVIAR